MQFIEHLDDRGLLSKKLEDFDYEKVIYEFECKYTKFLNSIDPLLMANDSQPIQQPKPTENRLKCDQCGCHPSNVIVSEKGTHCKSCWENINNPNHFSY